MTSCEVSTLAAKLARTTAAEGKRLILVAAIFAEQTKKYFTAPVFFLVFAIFMTPEVWFLERPVTHDHAVHFARIWHWIHQASKMPWGWNHDWLSGYPTGYMYPFLADWLVAGIHRLFSLLSGGTAPLGLSYSLAIILTHFLEGHSLYTLGRVMGYRKAGFLAGLVFMTQAGAPFVGGWFWTHYMGVWPVSLSISLSIYGCAAFHRLTQDPGPQTAGWFGLWWGLALMSHPLQMIHFSVMLPAMLFAVLWRGRPERRPKFSWLMTGAAVAVAIGSLWILPFLSVNEYSEKVFFVPWKSLPVLLGQLATGTVYKGLLPAMQFVGLAGIVLALRRGKPVMFAIALSCIVLIVTGSTTFYDTFHLGEVSQAFKTVQYLRFQAILRPFWCLAGAVFLLPYGASIFRRRGKLMVIALFLVASLPHAMDGLFIKFARHPHIRNHADYEAVVSWLRGVEAMDHRFFRIAVFNEPEKPFSHELPELVSRVRSPVLAMNYQPSINFKTAARTLNPETFKLLSIRFLISERANPEVLRFGNWQFRERKGRYFIYETSFWSEKRVSWLTPLGQVVDDKNVSQVLSDGNSLVADVSSDTTGFVLFHTAYFPRWRATWTQAGGVGRDVEVKARRFTSDVEMTSVTIPDKGSGKIELRFAMNWLDYLAIAIFIVGFCVALGLVFRRRLLSG